MSDSRVATRYARALFLLTEEQGVTDAVQRDLAGLAALVAASPDLNAFLSHGGLTRSEQQDTVNALFRGRVHELVQRLIDLLIARRRLPLLGATCEAFAELYRQARDILPAHVESAFPMPANQLEALRQKLAATYRKQIELQTETNPALLGGFVVRVKDIVHDCSVRGRLDVLRATLAHA